MAALQADTPPKADSQYVGILCDDNTKLCHVCGRGILYQWRGGGGGCVCVIIIIILLLAIVCVQEGPCWLVLVWARVHE